MVKAYVKMRDQQSRDEKNKKQFAHTSPRTLLGILRLAQALARLRFSEEVVQDDVDEALRLIEASKESLYQDQGGYGKDTSPSSRIYNMVRALAESGQCRPDDVDVDDDESLGMELSMKKVQDRVIAKGFTKDQWQTAVLEYTNLDVSCFEQFFVLNLMLIGTVDLANSRQWHTSIVYRLRSCAYGSGRGVRDGLDFFVWYVEVWCSRRCIAYIVE